MLVGDLGVVRSLEQGLVVVGEVGRPVEQEQVRLDRIRRRRGRRRAGRRRGCARRPGRRGWRGRAGGGLGRRLRGWRAGGQQCASGRQRGAGHEPSSADLCARDVGLVLPQGFVHPGSPPRRDAFGSAGPKVGADWPDAQLVRSKVESLMPTDGHWLTGTKGSIVALETLVGPPHDEVAQSGDEDAIFALIPEVRPLDDAAREVDQPAPCPGAGPSTGESMTHSGRRATVTGASTTAVAGSAIFPPKASPSVVLTRPRARHRVAASTAAMKFEPPMNPATNRFTGRGRAPRGSPAAGSGPRASRRSRRSSSAPLLWSWVT